MHSLEDAWKQAAFLRKSKEKHEAVLSVSRKSATSTLSSNTMLQVQCIQHFGIALDKSLHLMISLHLIHKAFVFAASWKARSIV